MAIKTISKNIFQKKFLYRFLSFLISAIVIILIFLFNKMNGKEFLVIRSDFLDCIGAYKEFVRNIINHDSLYFSFSTGMGLNNMMTMSGMFSPFTLLYLIFDGLNYNFITAVILTLKISLAALSFQIFSDSVLKNTNFSSIIISVFYSLNAYAIEYGTIQIGWMDALIILPILCASIVICIEKNRRVNVIILYAYLFISNYYMGYMVGIFTFLFVLFYLVFIYKGITEKPFKEKITKLFNWALGVLISIMISAFVWVPTLFFLASNRVSDSTDILPLNVSLLQILNSLFWGTSYGIDGTYSYIYCGIPVLMLACLFFFNKKIENKLKYFYGILIGILTISMVSNRLNTIWHVFDQPDGFLYRYSYLLCFCLCVAASLEIKNICDEDIKKIIFVILGLSFFYQLMLHTVSFSPIEAGVLNTNYGFIINLLLMILWSFILFFVFCKKKYKIICLVFALAILGFELISNSKRQMANLNDAFAYNSWNESVENAVAEIKTSDQNFYRMIISKNDKNYNSDLYFGFYGIGDFGNQEKYSVRKFLSNIGFATSPRVTCVNGYNPVANMLLGIKYELYAPDLVFKPSEVTISEGEDDVQEDLTDKDNFKTTYQENKLALNVGYMVNGETVFFEYPGRNVFVNMNEIVSSLSGIPNDCYVSYSKDDMILDSDNMTLVEMDTGDMVFERTDDIGEIKISIPGNNYKKAYIQFEKKEPGIYGVDYYVIDAQNASSIMGCGLGVSSAIEMNYDKEKDIYYITVGSYGQYSPELFICDDINIYYLDDDTLQAQFDELSKNQLILSDYSNGYLRGSVHVEGPKRLLFTTIPYDPGWKAYINGVEVEINRVIDGAFMGIWLPSEGDYEVTFDYECPGLKIGIIVSICGLFAFLSVVFEKYLKKKETKQIYFSNSSFNRIY